MKRLLAVLAVLLLAACGNASTSGGQAGPTASAPHSARPISAPTSAPPSDEAEPPVTTAAATPAASAPSASWSPWPSEGPPPTPTGTCGYALLGMDGATVARGSAALACFSRAVRACTPASIGYTEVKVDTGSDTMATIVPGSPCRARYVYDYYSANGGGSTSSKLTTQCTVTVNSKHVDFACSALTDEIPAG